MGSIGINKPIFIRIVDNEIPFNLDSVSIITDIKQFQFDPQNGKPISGDFQVSVRSFLNFYYFNTIDLNAQFKIKILLNNEEIISDPFDLNFFKSSIFEMQKNGEKIKEIEFKKIFNTEKKNLWWPISLRDNPNDSNLYDLTLQIFDNSGNLLFTTKKKIGFRSIILNTEKLNGDSSNAFYFSVNTIPLFAKGANYIPMDSFEDRLLSKESNSFLLSRIIQASVEANFNMFRIWGGGLYPVEEILEKCDEVGLLVWSESMFACGLYPTNSEFLESIEKETIQNVRRMISHPSLAIWGGNNENEQSLWSSTWYPIQVENKYMYYIDYARVYFETIYKVSVNKFFFFYKYFFTP